MIYEKKKTNAGKNRMFFWLVLLLFVVLCFELLYLWVEFSDKFWEMKFVDVANVIAQFATAGAFYLGFHQYQRSKRNERQAVLVSGCLDVIANIISVTKEVKVGGDTDFENIKYCIIKLGNLGSDFNVLFGSVDEGVHKALLRIRWQAMHFNDLQYVMQRLSLESAAEKCSILPSKYETALYSATKRAAEENVLEAFREYFVVKEILSGDLFQAVRRKFEFQDVYFFLIFYFDSVHTNDYMYGSLSRLDIRVKAPLVAALKDACGISEIVSKVDRQLNKKLNLKG